MKQIYLKARFSTIAGFLGCYEQYLKKGDRFLATEKILPVGSKFHFEINPPLAEKPFWVVAQVKSINLHNDTKGMNMEYSFADKDERQRIAHFASKINRRRSERPTF